MLESLYLHNFKSFYNSKFEFGKLNCLIAPNNTGKSNLVEALEFLDALIYENPVRAIAKVGFDNIKNKHHNDNEMYMNATFNVQNRVLIANELIDYDMRAQFIFTLNFDTKKYNVDTIVYGKIKSVSIDNADLISGFEIVRVNNFDNYIANQKNYLDLLSKKRFGQFHFSYNSTSLRYEISNTSYSYTAEIVKNLLALEISNNKQELVKPIDLRKIFYKFSLFASHYFHTHDIKRIQEVGHFGLLKNGTNLPEYLKTLDKETFDDISISLIGEVELINAIELRDGFTTELFFNEEVNGKITQVEMKNVSDGTIHFIAIMSAILGNRSSIGLLIEEPERHMHMKVLSYILNTMRDDDKQIFFTTHSTEFLSQLNLDEILFMFRDYEGDTKGIRAKEIKNIKKIMKLYKNDLVEMIKIGILDGLEDELL
jgi:predicted ATPase